MKKYFVYLLSSLIAFASCNSNTTSFNNAAATDFNVDSMKRNIEMLAADSLQGRKPFTIGETRTLNYLQKQFEGVGLEPGNGSSYLQKVPMVNILTTAAPSMHVRSAKGDFDLKGFDDYVAWTDKTDSAISINNSDLIFAGYGVVAPEYGWNDYAGLDVKGKTVLIMVNDPGFYDNDTTLFKGKTMTYYGRWTYKFEEAARQGAKGCLIIHTDAGSSYPFKVVQNSWNTSRLHLDNRGKNVPYCDMIGWVTTAAANKLLAAAGQDSSLLKKADIKGFKAVPLGLQLSTSMTVKATYNSSYNVIGKITGSTKPNEVIIYSAHWDHLGIGKPDEKGDSIYNGAIDNAGGVASLIELARAFKNLKTKPERTIVFLSVTAEEQGLWGSAYYAQNPVFPLAKTLCDINMDMVSPRAATHDIITVGKGQSDLEDMLKEEAEKVGRVMAFETRPEAGYYYRSDHFNFAKVGVPSLYISNGVDVNGKGIEVGQKAEDDYHSKVYHHPSDEYDPSWTMESAVADLTLLFNVGRRVASGNAFPAWKDGSEFKGIKR